MDNQNQVPVEETPVEQQEQVQQQEDVSSGIDRSAYNCPVCFGGGLQDDNTVCPRCLGTGKI
jgi:hypothetical protein